MNLPFILVPLAVASVLVAQEPATFKNGLRLLHVPVKDARDVSIAVAIPTGWYHDPGDRTGFAEVMRWGLTHAQRHRGAPYRFPVVCQPRLTLFSHSGPRRDAAARLAFVADVLSGGLEWSADLCALALGSAKLHADNHSWLFPGSVIQQEAWRAVLAGTPGGRQHLGVAKEIERIRPADLRERYRDHYGCKGATVVLIGDVEPDVLKEFRERLGAAPAGRGEPPVVTNYSAQPRVLERQHERVDGSFVSVAVAAPTPADADYLPFLVATILLRDEAFGSFRQQRRREWDARFPFLSYAAWADDRVFRINRRGPDGRTAHRARSEIEGVLERVRSDGPRRAQVESARLEVANTLRVPPFGSTAGPYLALRARYLAVAHTLSWPLDLGQRAEKVTPEQVEAVLESRFAPAKRCWLVLDPIPIPPLQGR